MKVLFCVSLAIVAFAMVSSEFCRDKGDCDHLTCDSSTTLGCSHGECTCLLSSSASSCNTVSCKARSDCDSCSCGRFGSRFHHHCNDNKCVCGSGFQGLGK